MRGQSFDEQKKALDVLRMSDQDHQAIVNELDRSSLNSPGKDKRKNKRLSYTKAAGLTLEVTHPGGTTVRFVVKPRNISRTGLSVLHGGFVHAGTPCSVPLRNLTGQTVPVKGRVVACRHIRGRVHEVGVEFVSPIDITRFVLDADAATMYAGESGGGPISLPTLFGTVLVVDEWEADRKLVEYDLQKLGLRAVCADGGADAIRQIKAGRFDVILCGEWLGDMGAADFVRTARSLACDTPIIGVFADGAGDAAAQAVTAGAGTVVAKPYKLEHLAQLLLQYLSLDGGGGFGGSADLSTKWVEAGMRPMILSFLQGLEIRLADLEQQLMSPSADPVQTCLRLKGAAASFGFPKISDTADQLARLVKTQADLDALKPQIDRLSALTSAALQAAGRDTAA